MMKRVLPRRLFACLAACLSQPALPGSQFLPSPFDDLSGALLAAVSLLSARSR